MSAVTPMEKGRSSDLSAGGVCPFQDAMQEYKGQQVCDLLAFAQELPIP